MVMLIAFGIFLALAMVLAGGAVLWAIARSQEQMTAAVEARQLAIAEAKANVALLGVDRGPLATTPAEQTEDIRVHCTFSVSSVARKPDGTCSIVISAQVTGDAPTVTQFDMDKAWILNPERSCSVVVAPDLTRQPIDILVQTPTLAPDERKGTLHFVARVIGVSYGDGCTPPPPKRWPLIRVEATMLEIRCA